jgi:pyruvate,water dikinase
MQLEGKPASPGVVTGPVVIIKNISDCEKLSGNEIMVTETSKPTLVLGLIKSRGVIADTGGITCHLASIARELNIPCVVGTQLACELLHDGLVVTLDGNSGLIYWD